MYRIKIEYMVKKLRRHFQDILLNRYKLKRISHSLLKVTLINNKIYLVMLNVVRRYLTLLI